jgi:hypothetical protein
MPENNHSTLDANELLLFVSNTIRKGRGESPLEKAHEVEEYFIENPMSIEQISEILIAAVFGVAYRQRSQKSAQTNIPPKKGANEGG